MILSQLTNSLGARKRNNKIIIWMCEQGYACVVCHIGCKSHKCVRSTTNNPFKLVVRFTFLDKLLFELINFVSQLHPSYHFLFSFDVNTTSL